MAGMRAFAPRRHRQGVAAVEFALLLPFLCFVFVAAVDYARIFYYSLTVTNCARNGALYGSADQAHALDTSGIQNASLTDAGNLDPHQMSVASSTDSGTSPTYVDVTVNYPFATIVQYPGIPPLVTLSRTVRMSVVPATPTFN